MTDSPDPSNCETPRNPGRPRSEAARKAILATAYAMLQESPLPEITSEALAKRAGVSKATLYRWWPSKEAIVLDGYFEALETRLETAESDDPLADLVQHIRGAYAAMAGPDGVIFASLIASGHFHPELRTALDEQLNSPRCKDTERLLQRAVDAGELREDLDLELVCDQLFGPLFGRLMTGQPIEAGLADRMLEQLLEGLRPRA